MDYEQNNSNLQQNQAAAPGIQSALNDNVNNNGNMEEENKNFEEDEQEQYEAITEEQNQKYKTQEQVAQQEELRNEALKFKEIWENFNKEFDTSDTNIYYLLSNNWFKLWCKNVSYERVIKDQEPNYQYFANQGDKLTNANLDLIENTVSQNSEEYFDYTDYCDGGQNIILKPRLQEIKDYIVINKDIVDLLDSKYKEFRVIPRKAYKLPDGKKRIEIYYRMTKQAKQRNKQILIKCQTF